jgi:hypothetical protein
MCECRPERDEKGRLLPGSTANPNGRPVRRPYLRLLEAAEQCGATVTIQVPAPAPPRRPRSSGDEPPRAA